MAARETYYTVEYAKTGRSSCFKTKKTIPEGSIRIGRNSPRFSLNYANSPISPFHDGYITKWFLPNPFFSKYGKDVQSISAISGFATLRPQDQAKLKTLAGEKVEAVQTTPEVHDLLSFLIYKDRKFVESQRLLEQSSDPQGIEGKFRIQQVLFISETKPNSISSVTQGGQDTLVDRIADGIIFGKAACATCSQPDQCQLKYNDGVFKCKTDLQWGVCGYEGTDVVIHPWKKNPEFLQTHPFMRNFPETPAPRPLKKVVKKIGVYKRDDKRPLRGMKFIIAGNIGVPHQEFADHIRRNGGTYLSAITPEVDYVVTSYPEIIKNSQKIQKAKEFKLAFVAPLLVDRLISEFGFSQEPYLLGGELPQIAFAQLERPGAASGAGDSKESDELAPPKKGTLYPEAKCPNGKIAVVDGVTYDVMMTMTDIRDGSNSYYLLQIIDVHSNGKVFATFRKWGRVGTSIGGSLVSSGSGFKTAFQIFSEQYLDKAGFDWEQRETATKQPGKYYPIALDDSDDKNETGEEQVEDSIPSYLEPKVRELVDMIFDVDMMAREVKSLDVDVRKMPLGKLKKEQISMGYKVLSEIEAVLNTNNPSEVQLASLSNQFYTLIPTDFGKNKVTLIDSFDTLKLKMRQLEALLDIQIASSLIQEDSLTGVHPTDQNYKRLGAILKPLSDFSREFKLVKKYIDNGYEADKLGYKIKLQNVFSVNRHGEREEFAPFKSTKPRKLLWHGSRLCNFVGILNQGLRIAPPEAPMSGYLFGKGIYFADRIQKSAAFCQPNKQNPIGLLLLCDVALGEAYEVKKPEYITELPKGKSHTLVLAKKIPDPAKFDVIEDQVVVPTGLAVPTNHKDVFVEEQEYVVYSRQLQIRYLVQVKFEFS